MQQIDTQAIAQVELNQYIERQAQELAPDFEIDSDEDGDFGELFRVWKGWEFLGSFYQNLDGKWVAQPYNRDLRPAFNTDTQAILTILAVTGNLVAQSAA